MLIENAPPQPFNGYKLKHPRLRGEDISSDVWEEAYKETPPLTRGRQSPGAIHATRDGNTPAYAGKTGERCRSRLCKRKHPRLRGEDSGSFRRSSRARETPPLTRGRLGIEPARLKAVRNTPAYAGKTGPQTPSLPQRQKHPRLRGEDAINAASKDWTMETPPLTRGRPFREAVDNGDWETPPLTRGRLFRGELHRAGNGNTPAYAGKTYALSRLNLGGEKHPRLRGEDPKRPSLTATKVETPPLTRGRQRARALASRADRNTPAYAGKTYRDDQGACRIEKHPRLRGEDRGRGDRTGGTGETPPLTRGRPEPPNGPSERPQKHPRLRGEDRRRSRIFSGSSETPPLTRGRPFSPLTRGVRHGNTPAYAGKTFSELLLDALGEKHPRLRGEDGKRGYASSSSGETPPLTRGRP